MRGLKLSLLLQALAALHEQVTRPGRDGNKLIDGVCDWHTRDQTDR